MAETVVCPVCGETNPADMEFCRNCQSRLHPLTGSLSGENAPIQPGQLPTKKETSELEPLLPQWLREARKQARESEPGAGTKATKDEGEDKGPAAIPGPDLLAGLASQAKDEEEETPDWLAHITGAPTKKKEPVPQDSQVKWVELGHATDAPSESSLYEESRNTKPAPTGTSQEDELTDWFRQASRPASDDSGFGPVGMAPGRGPESSFPEDRQPARSSDADKLAWLKNLDAAAPTDVQPSGEPTPPAKEEAPDWLSNLRSAADTDVQPSSEPTPPARDESPDWLNNPKPEAPADADAARETMPPAREEAPDWLKRLQAEQQPPKAPEPSAQNLPSGAPSNVPDWLKSFGQETPTISVEQPPAQEQAVPDQALPDWLQAVGSTGGPSSAVQPGSAADDTSAATELPDWISSLGPTRQPGQGVTSPTTPAFAPEESQTETPIEEPPTTGSAFTEEALAETDVEAIFASMQTPDWLSDLIPSAPPAEENVPAAGQEEESIGLAELPSWVQALRPVESAMAASTGGGQDTAPEERGPLAGLHGVLPVIPGAVVPSSKPKAHSTKLDATEQQQAHAALLEKILAAETSPIPMRAGSLLRSQKVLRWVISFLLLIVLGSVIFTGVENFPLPAAVPNETIGAVQAIEAVPADAPVLLVFDYQPSTVGEMEVAGASLLDHLLLLKHPHLVLLSTSPTGSALAERFMSTTLADRTRNYVRGVQYVDLGYLPGGLAGVYDFAQNPSGTMPLGADSKPVWQSTVLAPVTRFSDFAAVIVLTDSVESGRVWIEQSASSRGESSMVIAASAQAGPMLLPYVDSGQVNGLISGINGAAGAEQANGGLPGFVRRYWDAYSEGLYLAVLLILGGGLWNFWLGIQDRRAQAVL
jgi:hypothetical protein